MNDLKRLSILSLLVLTIAINGFAQDSTATEQPRLITFEEALRISMTNNYGIKEAECISNMKQEEMKAAKGLYLPQISLNASWIEMSEDIHLDLTPVRDAITPLYDALGNYGNFSGVPNPDPNTNQLMPTLPDEMSTQAVRGQLQDGLVQIQEAEWNKTIQEKSFGYVSAGFTYPLYVGGKIRMANKAANIRYQESLNELDLKNQQVTVELVERYYALVLAHEALEVRKEVFNTMELHLNDAKRLMEEGIISNAEYLHAKVYFSEADRELKKASRQIAIARQGLVNTLSMEDNSEIIPATQLFFTDNVPPLDYYLASVE
ncbi:MAG: TolC family protein, partial [Bacteroidales bacterium]|nr:TolC family protein [Bacteroidales bacterium]